MKRYIFLLLLICVASRISAQNFEVHQYGIREGLSIELTKSIVQDTFGFIWIATDEGVTRFDGYSFTSFNDIPGIEFGKQIIKLRDGGLILLSDLGVFQIKTGIDSAQIKLLIKGDRDQKPGYIWYPKSVFESRDGSLFISEGNAIVRYKEGKLKRFILDKSETSFNFIRAHYFAETETGKLIIITNAAGFYLFDEKKEKLIKIAKIDGVKNVASVNYVGKDRYLVGSNTGLYDISLSESIESKTGYEFSYQKRLFETLSISDIILINDRIVFSTWDKGLFSIDTSRSSLNLNNYSELGDIKINHLFQSTDGSVWCSTERGISLLSLRLFDQVDPDNIRQYIQDIIAKKNNQLVISEGSNVYEIIKTSSGFTSTKLLYDPNFVIISLLRFKTGILASLTNGELIYLDDSGTKSFIKLKHNGIFVKYMSYGVENDVWLVLEGAKEIINLKADLSYKKYDVSGLPIEAYSTIFSNLNGDIFAAGTADEVKLIKLNTAHDKFELMDLDLKLRFNTKITVNDIDFDKEGNPVLATSKGVFRVVENSVSPLTDALLNMDARSLAVDDVNSIYWVGSTDGLYKFDGQSVYHFDEISGLPSKTIGSRTLTIDNEGNIWVGTANGLAMMTGRSKTQITFAPIILLKSVINSKAFSNYSPEIEFVEGRDWMLSAFNPNFPSRSTLFQYRSDDDTVWRPMDEQNKLHLDEFDLGSHRIEFRARQQGNHSWSESTIIEFTILPLWYKRWWAVIIWALALIVIIYWIIRFNSRKLEAENLALEHLIEERTIEITEQNKELAAAKIEVEQKNSELESLLIELRALNATKDKMFSIISHDLKNPFTSIIGFSSILADEFESLTESEKVEFVNKIYNTSKRTYELLENLLNWSRSQTGRIEIQKVKLNLKEFIGISFELLTDSASTKSIELINDVEDHLEIFADYDTMNTVMRNLITNAIKFSMPGKSVEVNAQTDNKNVKISVADHGIGMSGETLTKLFRTDIFHSTNGTNEEKGTGLGLILCKEFVEKNGGTIDVQSEPGKGSTFIITLPVHSEK